MASLLERDAALAQLNMVARRLVESGAGGVVLLRSEAGVGKTAVLAHFVAELDPRLRVLRGWCDPLAAPRPLGPLIDTLASFSGAAADGLGAALDAGDTAMLYRRLLGVLGHGGRWVWVIEDAHWADGATLDLVRFLARRIGTLPLRLVISYCDDEVDATHPLAVTLGELAGCAAVDRIGLEPLSPQAVAVLASGSGINADRLYQLTDGNPFFVTEVLAAGQQAFSGEALPRSVSEAVWGRLARLSDTAREAAHAVAVCGPRADVPLVETVCPDAMAALDECIAAGVLTAEGDVVGFRHELARRATLDQMRNFERRTLHKRAMVALAEPPVDANTLAAMAFHADQAGDGDAVLDHAPAAAARAAGLGAHREAAELYDLVLRYAGVTPPEQKVVWLEQHAFERYLSGSLQTAAASWREAIALRRVLGDRLEEGDDLRWLSHMLLPMGDVTEAAEAGLASLRLLDDQGPSTQLAWSLANMAQVCTYTYDPRVAEYADRAINLGSKLADDGVVVRARGYAAMATVFFTDTGWDELAAVWRNAMGTEALAEHVGFIGGLTCWTAATHHDPSRAEGYIAEIRPFCAEHDLGIFQTLALGAEALVGLHRGEWDRTALFTEQVLTWPDLGPLHRILPLVTLALIRARRGDEFAVLLRDSAITAAEPDDMFRLGVVWAARAEVAWLAGDDDAARAEAQAGLAETSEHTDPWFVEQLRRWLHLAGGPTESTADSITPYGLEISGDWQAATEAWAARGCPYDAALAQLGGDIAAVESALATFRRLGAKAAARRAQQRLAALRGRTVHSRRTETLADPCGLTRRQREVLELLGGGHSDSGIAAILHVSPKTVGHHVEAILARLGVDNRAHAVAHALQRQTTTRD